MFYYTTKRVSWEKDSLTPGEFQKSVFQELPSWRSAVVCCLSDSYVSCEGIRHLINSTQGFKKCLWNWTFCSSQIIET